MESYKQRPDFAEMQIRNLLKELNGKDHNKKVKAIKKFQEYIDEFMPEVYDDDVDMLFLGAPEKDDMDGLLYWGGVQSDKHKLSLKRICPFVIALISHLVSIDFGEDYDNIFYERYIRLPQDELVGLNFLGHIQQASTAKEHAAFPSEGGKSYLHAIFELISLLLRDHYDATTDQPDPLELDILIDDDESAREQFMNWLQIAATNDIVTNVSSERKKQVALDRYKVVRPRVWDEVVVKPVPLQPDEDGYGDKTDVDPDAHKKPVSDPLGLVAIDLREIQSMHIGNLDDSTVIMDPVAEGKSADKPRTRSRGNSAAVAAKRTSTIRGTDLFNIMRKIALTGSSKSTKSVSSASKGNDESQNPARGLEGVAKREVSLEASQADESNAMSHRYRMVSILPNDRSFRPALFISLVHTKASLSDLQVGLTNLQVLLDQQSNMRENLVRLNLGHFINCVDSIAWLKSYQFENPTEMGYEESLGKRREKKKTSNSTEPDKTASDALNKISVIGRVDGEKMASQAVLKLEVAKKKALDTLAPILNSMKRSRQIKATDSILKRFASALDFPHLMQVALDNKDFEEVIRLNVRIKSMPNSVNPSIRNNIKSKAIQIVYQMKKTLLTDSLRNYPFGSVDEMSRLFKNLSELDAGPEYMLALEKCFERQHGLFLMRFSEILKSCDEELTKIMLPQNEESKRTLSLGILSPRRAKRGSRASIGVATVEDDTNPYSDSEEESMSDESVDFDVKVNYKTHDQLTLCNGIRVKCFKSLISHLSFSFPILHSMVVMLEAGSVVGGAGVSADELGLTSPVAMLKGLDVAYGRRHGGASKFANTLGSSLQKYSLVLKRLIEGFPEEVMSVSVTTTFLSSTAGVGSPSAIKKKGLWSRIDDIEKVTTPAIDDQSLPAPAAQSTTASLLFAQGSGDTFGATVELSKGRGPNSPSSNNNQGTSLSKCREPLLEPYLSASIRIISELREAVEDIIAVSFSNNDDSSNSLGMWICVHSVIDGISTRQSSASPFTSAHDNPRHQPCFLPQSSPYYHSIAELQEVVQNGEESIASRTLKILEEATTRLMLSAEANLAIEEAHSKADIRPGFLIFEDVDLDAAHLEDLGKEKNSEKRVPIYDPADLLLLAQDNYRETYAATDIQAKAKAVISSGLMNPKLTSFNDNSSRSSMNDENNLNKLGASLETKAYQFEFMIVHTLANLHDSLRRPDMVSDFVTSAIRTLFTQFVGDLNSAECPVIDSVGGVLDKNADEGGFFAAKRSALSIDLEMIELDLKVDGGAGDKSVLIDNWYIDQIRACLAIRSVIAHRVCAIMNVLFPQVSEAISSYASKGVSSKRASAGGRTGTRVISLSHIKSAAAGILKSGSTQKRRTMLNNANALVNDRAENFVSTVDEAVDSTSILAYLKDNLKKEKSEVIVSIVVEVAGVEDEIVQRYLEVQTLKLRTSIQASYSVVVRSEMSNKWGQSTRQSILNTLSKESLANGQLHRVLPSSRVPSCLARVLFEMSLQRSELTKALGWITITEGLMTPAPTVEIAAALAVHQHNMSGNFSVANGSSPSSSLGNPVTPTVNSVSQDVAGWRGRVGLKYKTDMAAEGIKEQYGQSDNIKDFSEMKDKSLLDLSSRPQAPRYEEFLFCALCVSLLDIYTELIEQLASNTFTVQATGSVGKKVNVRRMSTIGGTLGASPAKKAASTSGPTKSEIVLSHTNGGYGSNSNFPKSLSRAAEEYVFLKTAIQPLLMMSAFETPSNVTIISDHLTHEGVSDNNEEYPSADELLSATKIYVECFKKNRNMTL